MIALEDTCNSLATANGGYIRELDDAAAAAVDEAMRFDTAVRRVISVDDDEGSWSAIVVCWWRRSPSIKTLINFIVDFVGDISQSCMLEMLCRVPRVSATRDAEKSGTLAKFSDLDAGSFLCLEHDAMQRQAIWTHQSTNCYVPARRPSYQTTQQPTLPPTQAFFVPT